MTNVHKSYLTYRKDPQLCLLISIDCTVMCLRSGNRLGLSADERATCFLLHWVLLFLDGGAPILSDLPSVNRQSPWLQCQTGWYTARNMMYELWREAQAQTITRVNLPKAFQRLEVSLF